jgi:hypothetical protein
MKNLTGEKIPVRNLTGILVRIIGGNSKLKNGYYSTEK